jgi:hypothetical protein
MNAHADCYGRLFPSVRVIAHNDDVAGKVFGYRVEQSGIVSSAPTVSVNGEAWENCTRCAEFETCYRLSLGKLLMDIAVRS